MDATHEEQLARILANRRSRGAAAGGTDLRSAVDLREPSTGVQRVGSEVRLAQPPSLQPYQARQDYVPAAEENHFGRSGSALAAQRRTVLGGEPVGPSAPSATVERNVAAPSTVPSLLRSGSSLAGLTAPPSGPAATTAAAAATANVSAPPAVTSATSAPQRAPSVVEELIGRRGAFDHFRDRPLLVSANIRSYSPPRRSSAAPQTLLSPTVSRSGVPAADRHVPVTVPAAAAAAAAAGPPLERPGSSLAGGAPSGAGKQSGATAAVSFSKQNPFRTQTFEDFCVAPHYDRSLPEEVVVPQHHRQRDTPSPLVTAMSSPPVGNPPLFDSQQAIAVLLQGDWFLKWTRIDSAHRRYVWLDLGRGVLSWASSRDASFFMQRSIKLEDIMDLRPACAVDEVAGRTFYKLIIVSLDRELKIGTEIRDKFDVWFDTMQRLCEAQRTYTNTYIGRHAANNRLATSGGDFVRRVEASAATE